MTARTLFSRTLLPLFTMLLALVALPAAAQNAACIDNLAARAKTGAIQLTWTHVVGTTRYDVERATALAGPFGALGSTTSTVSTYLDSPVANATTYYYRIHRIFEGGACYSGVIAAIAPAARSAMAQVPALLGDLQADALAELGAASLQAGTVGSAHSDTVGAGRVLSQDPPAGSSVPVNSAVAFVVSDGPAPPANVLVPDVVGQTQAAAAAAIAGASLAVGTVSNANSNTVPSGSVISQNPSGGTSVAPGSTVNIVVSLGPANVSVPNVVNLTQAAATTALTNAGLALGTVTQANSNTVPSGSVISQNPAAGASVAPGSAVSLVVSTGPALVSVPNVVNLTQAAASAAITGAGLVVGTVTNANSNVVPAGSVISQSPGAGSTVLPGSAVNLTVSIGPAQVAVPNVVNLTQAAASTAITGAGLVVGTVTNANSNTVPSGSVISQNPTAGTNVAPGSAVSLVVSIGPASSGATSLSLDVSQRVLAAGGSAGIIAQALDSGGNAVVPAPGITYEVLFDVNQTEGQIPAVNGAQLVTGNDTRGVYTLRGTVNGTSVTASIGFTVVANATQSSNIAKYATLSGGISTAEDQLALLLAAIQANDSAGINAANSAILAARNGVNLNALRRSTPVTPETGFLPSIAQLNAAGYPSTAGNTAFGNLLPQIDNKLNEIITYYNTLNPASGTDDVARLNQLTGELQAMQTQLAGLTVTARGIVANSTRLNRILANTFPRYLHAVATRGDAVLRQQGLVAAAQDPAQFYTVAGAGTLLAQQDPAKLYETSQPVFFGLVGLMSGMSTQMSLVNRIYGPILAEVSRWMVILAAQNVLGTYLNASQMEGIVTGGSQSFHAYNLGGSTIQLTGAATSFPERNDVWLVGPAGIAAAQSLITSFNPSNINSLQDVYDFIQGIKEAAEGAISAAQQANQIPNSVEQGCLLDFFENGSCYSLVYDSGFSSVRSPGGLSLHPVLILVNNMDTGAWSMGLFNFTGG